MVGIDLLLSDHLLLMILILGCASFVHGLLGIGFPLLATPLIALFTDVRTVMLLLLVPTMTINIASMIRGGRWGESIGRYWPLAVFVAFGSMAGTYLLVLAPQIPYKLLMAAVLLVYLNVHRNRIDTHTYRRWLRYVLLIIAILLMVQYGLGGMA